MPFGRARLPSSRLCEAARREPRAPARFARLVAKNSPPRTFGAAFAFRKGASSGTTIAVAGLSAPVWVTGSNDTLPNVKELCHGRSKQGQQWVAGQPGRHPGSPGQQPGEPGEPGRQSGQPGPPAAVHDGEG